MATQDTSSLTLLSNILARLQAEEAAPVLQLFQPDFQSQIIEMFLKINKKKKDTHFKQTMALNYLREQAGKIISAMTEDSKRALVNYMKKHQATTLSSIKVFIYLFDDLFNLSDKNMQFLLNQVLQKYASHIPIAMALKPMTKEMQDKFLNNLSSRKSLIIQEDMDYMGAVHVKDIEECQKNILLLARQLELEGKIIIKEITNHESTLSEIIYDLSPLLKRLMNCEQNHINIFLEEVSKNDLSAAIKYSAPDFKKNIDQLFQNAFEDNDSLEMSFASAYKSIMNVEASMKKIILNLEEK